MTLSQSTAVAACLVALTFTTTPAAALQAHDTLPANAYARAEQFMQHKMGGKVYRDRIDVHWLQDGYRFWYEVSAPGGSEYHLVDPASNTKQLLFDRVLLARALSAALDSTVEASRLRLAGVDLAADTRSVRFSIGERRMSCELQPYHCTTAAAVAAQDSAARRSPDGLWDAYVRDHDLWVRRVACTATDGECDTRLTTDGHVRQSYGRAGTFSSIHAGRKGLRQPPHVVWSPDSRKLAVTRWDDRGVENFYYISSTAIRPELFTVPQSIPSDSIVERYDIHILDIADRSNLRVATEQIPWVRGNGGYNFVSWSPGSDRILFVGNDRGPTRISLMSADARTGQAQRLITDSINASNVAISEYVLGSNIWSLSRGNDVFWYSEREGGSHIYRYDSAGTLINRVTEGPWNVMAVDKVDSTRNILYLRGRGRESDHFHGNTLLYRVRPDGTGLTLLTPEPGDHAGTFSPDGRFFIDTYSSTGEPPAVVLRSTENGRIVRELERADVSHATALGWEPPTVVRLTAADGVTPIHAVIWKPTDFDSTRRYPVVNHIYPMPLGSHPNWTFAGPASEQQALAELGFIVVRIQPRGVRDPSPAIRNVYRTQFGGRYGEGTLPDHVEALKQLGARFRWFDIGRIGLYGMSGGGFVTTAAMLRYPDFFKAGVAFAGNHDDRSEHIIVGESWRGLYRKGDDGSDNYEGDANYLLAGNLKGKLLLVHGDLDEGVHPSMSIRLASALIDAGKRFDFMILPDNGHTTGGWFGSRLVFDYFVHNLMGLEPPEYTFTGTADPILSRRPTGATN